MGYYLINTLVCSCQFHSRYMSHMCFFVLHDITRISILSKQISTLFKTDICVKYETAHSKTITFIQISLINYC